jgi:hypothetical protein
VLVYDNALFKSAAAAQPVAFDGVPAPKEADEDAQMFYYYYDDDADDTQVRVCGAAAAGGMQVLRIVPRHLQPLLQAATVFPRQNQVCRSMNFQAVTGAAAQSAFAKPKFGMWLQCNSMPTAHHGAWVSACKLGWPAMEMASNTCCNQVTD